MARLIGMDEAGLGPNLGPLVVAVTVWDVPSPPRDFDFWNVFSDVLTNAPEADESRLHVADSKQVFQPHRGFGALERGVLSALGLLGFKPRTVHELFEFLKPADPPAGHSDYSEHWADDKAVSLPSESHDFSCVNAWKRSCKRNEVRLLAVKAAIVKPRHFNQMVREYDNKSLVVSRIAFRLLRSVWSPDDVDTFIVGDKHGGRNRYDHLLAEILDGEMFFCLEEGAERSDYRVGKTLLRFEPRAEVHGPVALASMTAKYLRELAMAQFNRYWATHVPGLKPTQGYPNDAVRFRDQIAEMQRTLGITDDDLWRCR